MYLEECPFCGSNSFYVKETITTVGNKKHKVFCHGCEANGSTAETKEKAIMGWNERKVCD